MAIPKYDEMYLECLKFLSDQKEHQLKEIREVLATKFHLSDEERRELLPSGKQPVFNNRVTWTCGYLKKAGLVTSPARGVYAITDAGIDVLSENPSVINNDFLSRFESFREFIAPEANRKGKPAKLLQSSVESNQTPQDTLESAYAQINAALIEDVLTEVMNQTPIFFEHLVVRLLTAMGYGGSLEGAATVTRASGDEGIDGIIREDKLGFSSIYIQAKRWDRNGTVGRPEIQKFVGALMGQGANKGLFITTAQFTREAKEYADKYLGTKLVLIDGVALAKLMIEYDVGVSVETTYAIKRVDSDFFDDNLA